jgi:negative regulator of sigma E activity
LGEAAIVSAPDEQVVQQVPDTQQVVPAQQAVPVQHPVGQQGVVACASLGTAATGIGQHGSTAGQ